ncbi:hypothetical protein K469DRAFT_741698 [Zopfia rhizophila CBS 207.26]|uniref:LysR family regulatory protein n=1 Tax=Zopfia rhizophila CBS 207.26 TaxID=1314779 RepID=A0A6A6DI45_9PEZI|nr:hypothetical protein K469DRAFT_741698 [Zopfia rhizophila CBS 207.26]
MFGLFGASSAHEPGDANKPANRVVPLHFFDDGPLWRAFILYSMFVFDHVLDAERLRTSLERLVHKDGWWKLGARLRRNKNGELEYHIPAAFTTERSALAYSHIEYNVDAADHPLASRLPKASTKPAIVGDPDEFHDHMRPAGSPMKLNDYINADRPQLGLHIVSFKDTTFVSLYWPHTLCDAMGKKAILDAWSLIIQGREDEVRAPHGAEFDPFTKLGTNPTEEFKLAPRRMGTFELVGYGLGQVLDFIRKQENRMVCVPPSFLEKLRESAIADLAGAQENNNGEKPFLTEGDVLCAWWTRLAITHLPRDSSRTVVLSNAYCLRKVLRQDLIPEGAPYVSNAIGFINVLLPVKDIVKKPLSYVAKSIRTAIAELGTRPQVETFFAMVRESQAKLPPFFGHRNMHMITYSNWTRVNLFEVDFSAAVVGGAPGEKVAKPRYIQNNQFGLILPNGFPIIGKDNDGNYWLSGYMNKAHWAKIGELLAQEV